jgi:exonuclease III
MSSTEICTFNVKCLASTNKRDRVLCWLNQQTISIALLQEIHYNSNTDDTENWSAKWNGKSYSSGNSTYSLGVGINTSCNCKILEYQEIIVGRMQRIKLEIEEKVINIFNVYAPNNDDINFFNILETNLDKFSDEILLVGGDVNTVINHSLDKLHGKSDTNKRTSN